MDVQCRTLDKGGAVLALLPFGRWTCRNVISSLGQPTIRLEQNRSYPKEKREKKVFLIYSFKFMNMFYKLT